MACSSEEEKEEEERALKVRYFGVLKVSVEGSLEEGMEVLKEGENSVEERESC